MALDRSRSRQGFKQNVFLVGLMGSGKTTVGRRLARLLGVEFLDSDHEIVRRTGAEIPLIFEIEGEQGFQRREKTVIDDLTQCKSLVLATGGGAILDPDNRRHLRNRGCVIYLSATIDHLLERTRGDRNRPLLQTEDPRRKLEELFEVRDPLYRETAHIVLDTANRGPAVSARELARRLTRRRTSQA